MTPKTGYLIVTTVVSAGLLYSALLVFIALVDPLGSAAAFTCAAAIALAVLAGLELRLTGHARIRQGLAVNGALWPLFAVLVAADGLLFHPGLAKDVESSSSGVLRYFVHLLVLAVPGAVISTGFYLLAVKLRQ